MSELCDSVHRALGALARHRFPFDAASLPRDGLYVLFERGESAHGTDRIVRIGTHTGDGQLQARLRQHFLLEKKDRSIFRKNIGRAMLNREGNPFLKLWEIDLTTRRAREQYGALIDPKALKAIEAQVTSYMQNAFSFAVLPVAGREQRLRLESALISTVSLCEECQPSSEWLGRRSPKEEIRESGLWQVNELYKQPLTAAELAEIQGLALTQSGNRG
jgi:hypothetical protein